jgi:hypothetical protein
MSMGFNLFLNIHRDFTYKITHFMSKASLTFSRVMALINPLCPSEVKAAIKHFIKHQRPYMELVQGMRNKSELGEFRKALRQWKATILFINEEISAKAMFFVERHFLGHAMQIADAHIAATAMVNAYPILTANDKHYRVIKEIDLKIFRP